MNTEIDLSTAFGIGMVTKVPFRRVRFFADQPRTYFNPQNLQELASSIKQEGQKDPVWVKIISGDPDHDFELVDGERRWRAIEIAEVETILIWIVEVKDTDDQFVTSIIANFGRADHTHLEVARAIKKIQGMDRMVELSEAEQVRQIANMFAKSEPYVKQHLALLKLHPAVQAMMEETVDEGLSKRSCWFFCRSELIAGASTRGFMLVKSRQFEELASRREV